MDTFLNENYIYIYVYICIKLYILFSFMFSESIGDNWAKGQISAYLSF